MKKYVLTSREELTVVIFQDMDHQVNTSMSALHPQQMTSNNSHPGNQQKMIISINLSTNQKIKQQNSQSVKQ